MMWPGSAPYLDSGGVQEGVPMAAGGCQQSESDERDPLDRHKDQSNGTAAGDVLGSSSDRFVMLLRESTLTQLRRDLPGASVPSQVHPARSARRRINH